MNFSLLWFADNTQNSFFHGRFAECSKVKFDSDAKLLIQSHIERLVSEERNADNRFSRGEDLLLAQQAAVGDEQYTVRVGCGKTRIQ
jgi:hypothetical protein